MKLGPAVQNFPRGGVVSQHWRDADALIFVERGFATVRDDRGTWVAHAGHALFVTSRAPHALKLGAGTRVRVVPLPGRGAERAPTASVRVSPLLRELVFAFAGDPRGAKAQAALALLLRDEIQRQSLPPLFVPEPKSENLAEICRELRRETRRPAARRRAADRLFRAELGVSLREWRQRARLLRAIELLGEGREVGDVAEKSGFASASSFVFSFRNWFGAPPGRYIREGAPSAS